MSMRRLLWLGVCLSGAAYAAHWSRDDGRIAASVSSPAPVRESNSSVPATAGGSTENAAGARFWKVLQPRNVPTFVVDERRHDAEEDDAGAEGVANLQLCVFGGAGEPKPGLEVALNVSATGRLWVSGTDDSGCVRLSSLPTGSVTVSVRDGAMEIQRQWQLLAGENEFFSLFTSDEFAPAITRIDDEDVYLEDEVWFDDDEDTGDEGREFPLDDGGG